MFPPGLSMLWESADPARTLRDRFGFGDTSGVCTWLTGVLDEHWSVRLRDVKRILLSDHNAIAWTHTDQGTFVVKICADASRFTRLGLIADVVTHLGEVGLPVPVPRPADDGATRVVVERPAGAGVPGLSVIVQPEMPGVLLDAGDLAAARSAGAVLARLHLAVGDRPHAGHLAPEEGLHRRLRRIVGSHAPARAPRAVARLAQMLTDLPAPEATLQLVHRDYRSTNVLMTGTQVSGVLDFDEMRLDHRVLDLARASVLLATRFTTWGPTSRPAREAFAAGYIAVHPLSEVERAWLQAAILALGLSQIPEGPDRAGWAESVEVAAQGPRW